VVKNIKLPPTLLSRFDLIYLMLDRVNKSHDEKLAIHILDLYTTHPEAMEDENYMPIDSELLSKYISYARSNIHPKITKEASTEMINEYVAMRRQGTSRNVITATPR